MDARHRGIQILGWLAIIAGYGLALLLIRGIFLGITRGFGAVLSQTFAILLAYLLFFALAVYLFSVGRRARSIANGSPRPKARFGWGRMLLGAILLFSSANNHFHLFPTRTVIKPLEPSNPTQAAAMNVTAVVIAIGCIILIFSGIWIGVRRQVVKS
jgi:hypothetical protein